MRYWSAPTMLLYAVESGKGCHALNPVAIGTRVMIIYP